MRLFEIRLEMWSIILVGFTIVSRLHVVTSDISNDEYFSTQPKSEPYFVKERDSNVVLSCAAKTKYAQEPFTMNWIKIINNSPRILTTGQANRASEWYDLDLTACSGCYNLRIKNVAYERDNGKFFCQITGPNNVDVNSKAEVVVLVKPGAPLISVQPVAPLRAGTTGRIDCQSAGGSPPPTIRWYFSNGTEVTHLAQQTNASDLNSPTTSSLQWSVNAGENNLRVTCKIWNEAMGESAQPLDTQTSALSVLYPPRVAVGPSPIYSVELGSTANLFCSAESNPPPIRYAWHLNGNIMQQNGPNLTLTGVSKMSAGNYTCYAFNDDSSGQDTLNLNVQYAPEITTPTEFRATAGKKATLVCTVDANPAPTSVSWSGPNGRTSEGNLLDLSSVSLKDMGNYNCTAKNFLNLYSTGAVPRIATKVVTVLVDHAPGKGIVTTAEPVVAGATANLSCSTDVAGSPPAQFRWKAPGQQDFEHASRPTYTIYDVQMTHAGVYSCLPWNSVGLGEVGTLKLVVYDPARLEQLLKTDDTKNEGDVGYYLTCSARGHPAPNITWYKDGVLIGENEHWNVTQRVEQASCDIPDRCPFKTVGFLQWKDNIKWSDKGALTCQAFNGAGKPAQSNISLKVYHKPVVTNDPSRPFAAADVGRSVDIECKASARPEPTFSWFKDGKTLNSTMDASLFSISNQRNDSFDVYESTLTIRRVQDTDLGEYACKAVNHLGENQFTFTLQTKRKPMLPENLRAADQTHRSILLSWTPGYDGGSPQTFTVEVFYPNDLPTRTFTVSDVNSGRFKRHVGIEKPTPVTLNITSDIAPSSEYKFRVQSKNELGTTDWTLIASAWTDDAPLDTSIPKVTFGMFYSDSLTLEFKPTNLDAQLYCLLIYRKDSASGKYLVHSCVDPTNKADGIASSTNFKTRFCLRQTLTCGEPLEVLVGGAQASISWEIIVAIVAAAVFLLIVAIVACFYCRRCRRFKGEKKKQPQQIPKMNGLRKDYEMESNQVRPKAISGPFLTDKTPGPSSGLSSLDQNTGSSKDSGVFTTGSNYHYNPNGYNDNEMGHVYPMGNGVVRTTSCDDQEHWGVTDGYGLNNSYMGAGDYPDGDLVNRGYEPGGYYDPTSGYPDPYAHHGVDMNPNPHLNGGSQNDGSMTSAYSTPSQRRIIREIIV